MDSDLHLIDVSKVDSCQDREYALVEFGYHNRDLGDCGSIESGIERVGVQLQSSVLNRLTVIELVLISIDSPRKLLGTSASLW
jgi:hypothetical protein